MKLQCHKCSSINTQLVPKAKMAKIIGAEALAPRAGVLADPMAIIGVVTGIVSAVYSYLQYKLAKDESLICVCKDCGYWEKL